MPTNDERRDVAVKLRDMAVRTNPSWPALMEALGTPGRSVTVQYLADLIEPEERTCRVYMKWDGLDGHDPTCSACGAYLDDEKWCELKFCPNCGAKVVGE